MALTLSSRHLQERALREAKNVAPAGAAAGTALATSHFLGGMMTRRGRLLAMAACIGGGGYMAIKAKTQLGKSAAVGLLGGGLWSLLRLR